MDQDFIVLCFVIDNYATISSLCWLVVISLMVGTTVSVPMDSSFSHQYTTSAPSKHHDVLLPYTVLQHQGVIELRNEKHEHDQIAVVLHNHMCISQTLHQEAPEY